MYEFQEINEWEGEVYYRYFEADENIADIIQYIIEDNENFGLKKVDFTKEDVKLVEKFPNPNGYAKLYKCGIEKYGIL